MSSDTETVPANGDDAKPEGRKSKYGHFAGFPKDLEVDKLFRALVKLEGSDLHLKAGSPPFTSGAGSWSANRTLSDI